MYYFFFISFSFFKEQPSFDKKQFVTWMKRYIKLLTPKLEGEKQEEFKKNIEGATKFLLSKIKDLQLYVFLIGLLLVRVINIWVISVHALMGRVLLDLLCTAYAFVVQKQIKA